MISGFFRIAKSDGAFVAHFNIDGQQTRRRIKRRVDGFQFDDTTIFSSKEDRFGLAVSPASVGGVWIAPGVIARAWIAGWLRGGGLIQRVARPGVAAHLRQGLPRWVLRFRALPAACQIVVDGIEVLRFHDMPILTAGSPLAVIVTTTCVAVRCQIRLNGFHVRPNQRPLRTFDQHSL